MILNTWVDKDYTIKEHSVSDGKSEFLASIKWAALYDIGPFKTREDAMAGAEKIIITLAKAITL